MRKALLLATLLILGAVAAAPAASADDITCSSDAPRACGVAAGAGNTVLHYAECYLTTGPIFWADECA